MKKLSFKEYYESKELLRSAILEFPKTTNEYVVKKYCKLPILLEGEKEFIALKPRDIIKIQWEFIQPNSPTAKTIIIESDLITHTYIPFWADDKLQKWVLTTTFEKSK